MNKNFSVSVVMCTYNGEKFIKQQIESIMNQTIIPDELLIFDDKSTDNTIQIIDEMAKLYSCISVSINKENLGYKKNFAIALSKAKGDYVFLSDQDDLWKNNKIERMVQIFNDSNANVVTSNMHLIDENNAELGMYHSRHFIRLFNNSNKQWRVLMKYPRFPGMSVAARKSFLDSCFPFPENYSHDEWICICASLTNSICVLDECLSLYRQHQSQAIGAKISFATAKNDIKLLPIEIEKTKLMVEWSKDKIEELSYFSTKKLSFLRFRQKQRFSNSFLSFIKQLFFINMTVNYFTFCKNPIKSIAKDIVTRRGE